MTTLRVAVLSLGPDVFQILSARSCCHDAFGGRVCPVRACDHDHARILRPLARQLRRPPRLQRRSRQHVEWPPAAWLLDYDRRGRKADLGHRSGSDRRQPRSARCRRRQLLNARSGHAGVGQAHGCIHRLRTRHRAIRAGRCASGARPDDDRAARRRFRAGLHRRHLGRSHGVGRTTHHPVLRQSGRRARGKRQGALRGAQRSHGFQG